MRKEQLERKLQTQQINRTIFRDWDRGAEKIKKLSV